MYSIFIIDEGEFKYLCQDESMNITFGSKENAKRFSSYPQAVTFLNTMKNTSLSSYKNYSFYLEHTLFGNTIKI